MIILLRLGELSRIKGDNPIEIRRVSWIMGDNPIEIRRGEIRSDDPSDIRRGEIRGDNPGEIRRVRLGVMILVRLDEVRLRVR